MLDLDDTLFLERNYVRSGFQAVGEWVSARFSISDFALRAWRRFEEGCRGNIFDLVLEECARRPGADDIASMISIYRQHDPSIALLPDASEFLAFCRPRFPLALISDGFAEAQSRKLKALGIENSFAVVVLTGERPGWSKPNLPAFLHVQEQLGGSGEKFCYIADNPLKDFHAPRQLGWTAIRIRREQGIYSSFEAQPAAEPHSEIRNLGVLQNMLAALEGTARKQEPAAGGGRDGNVSVCQKRA